MKAILVVIIGLYACAMVVMPFGLIYASHEGEIYARELRTAFIDSSQSAEMGKLIDVHMDAVQPWIGYSHGVQIGFFTKQYMTFERWRGFLEVYASKRGKWQIDNLVKGEE